MGFEAEIVRLKGFLEVPFRDVEKIPRFVRLEYLVVILIDNYQDQFEYLWT